MLICAPSCPSHLMHVWQAGSWDAAAAPRDAEHVREFTGGAGQPTPDKPVLMTKDEVCFLGKMVLDEVMIPPDTDTDTETDTDTDTDRQTD